MKLNRLKVAIDQGVNLKKLRQLQREGRIELMQVHDTEQIFKGTSTHGGAFTIGQSAIGGLDMIAGDNIDAVRSIVGENNKNDFRHLYAAHLKRVDYFITEDTAAFIDNGKRQQLEGMLNIKIRRTNEFLDELA